jgi:hypothetical protein
MTTVTASDGSYDGRFNYAKASRWSDEDYNGNGSGGTGRGQAVLLTAGDRWVLENWTRWQGETSTYQWITPEKAREWLLLNSYDDAAEELLGPQPEEEDKRPGRPGIGTPVQVRLGDTLPLVDQYAQEDGVSRAEWVRRAVFGAIERRTA